MERRRGYYDKPRSGLKTAIKEATPGFLTFISIVLWMADAGQVIDIGWGLILLPIWGPVGVGIIWLIIQEKLWNRITKL